MATRSLKAVLHNFVDSFTSRYTDYDGYLLFGFVTDRLDQLEIDLLGHEPDVDAADHMAVLIAYARALFLDQAQKQRLETGALKTARLTVRRSPGPSVRVFVSDGYVDASEFTFAAEAVIASGRKESRFAKRVIGTCDPAAMSRSIRRGPPKVR